MMEKIVQSLRMERENPFCAYLYDLSKLRHHVHRLMTTLPSSCRLFYAIKANSDVTLLKTLAPIVHGFEVASLGEIEKVRAVDKKIPILFGGPGKTQKEIEGAIHYGVTLLHVESLHELQLVNHIASQKGTTVSILLRVNLRSSVPNAQLKMAGVPTQFGIDEVEVPNAIALAKCLPNLKLLGFHFHAMSNNGDSKTHAYFVDHCFEMEKTWQKEWDIDISYINVGGGIGINYQDVEEQFDWDDFMKCVKKVVEKHKDANWQTLFECGRYITSSCGYYAAEVLDIKQNHGKNFCVVRGGSHHLRLPAAWKQSHPFTIVPVEKWPYPFTRPEVNESVITVAGELCTPNDVLARDISVPRVRVGDILLFSYAGAYGWAISHHDFLSHPHPEHLYIESNSIKSSDARTEDQRDESYMFS
ncbi:type III PLP-dependent enzyme [Peribacillus cavernae]|uniref:Type III PLP-dependent enzyme n=1 Tax=Peribacillus cavernae TaxID=1674310 RepID=A0A3S0TZL3_9BACI|nr:type III PLP-dependent enzyme [Peribacillus cavernae]MDQ0219299.1 diaminopimelate decarboxylase [Peribacillus cavernae]RUQ27816.1 type III PLP-dependent enzyme [Peribacillus cavernae]